MDRYDERSEQWIYFYLSREDEEAIPDDEKDAMFMAGWKDGDWTVDKDHTALWQWREERMRSSAG